MVCNATYATSLSVPCKMRGAPRPPRGLRRSRRDRRRRAGRRTEPKKWARTRATQLSCSRVASSPPSFHPSISVYRNGRVLDAIYDTSRRIAYCAPARLVLGVGRTFDCLGQSVSARSLALFSLMRTYHAELSAIYGEATLEQRASLHGRAHRRFIRPVYST
jgi:hypothetical protein